MVKDVIPIILRFGKYRSNAEPVEGFDLALVKFESDKEYLVAPLSQLENLQADDRVFVSGWPQPENQESFRIPG